MNIFQRMIDDLFLTEDFTEQAIVDNRKITVVVYQITEAELYTLYGSDQGVSFYFTCKRKDYQPKKGDRITIRNTDYKVQNSVLDSHGLTYNVFLKSLSSR